MQCPIYDFNTWLATQGENFPVDESRFTSVFNTWLMTSPTGQFHLTNLNIGLIGGVVKFHRIHIKTKGNILQDYNQKFPLYQEWESYRDSMNLNSPSGLNKAFQSAGEAWPFMMLERAF